MSATLAQQPADLIGLTPLMKMSSGLPDVVIGLIDGPVDLSNSALSHQRARAVGRASTQTCAYPDSPACQHATFISKMLVGASDSPTPGICPDCTLLTRQIFYEGPGPLARAIELADALVEVVRAGARIINISAALTGFPIQDDQTLVSALSYASWNGALVVAAAGNRGAIGGTAITHHPWVIPVVGCDRNGLPTTESNLSRLIGLGGLRAPAEAAESFGALYRGTSVAAAFVSGSLALLWTHFPLASAVELRAAIAGPMARRRSIVPPLLDAWTAYHELRGSLSRR